MEMFSKIEIGDENNLTKFEDEIMNVYNENRIGGAIEKVDLQIKKNSENED